MSWCIPCERRAQAGHPPPPLSGTRQRVRAAKENTEAVVVLLWGIGIVTMIIPALFFIGLGKIFGG
jgi:hypothetical protein